MREQDLENCPCCGEKGVELFDPCPVCGWWNDYAQAANPDFAEGENSMSLNEARAAWRAKQKTKAA